MIYGGLFDLDNKIKRLDELEVIINDANLWDDKDYANKIIKEGIALLPDDAKGDFKAQASDIFIDSMPGMIRPDLVERCWTSLPSGMGAGSP